MTRISFGSILLLAASSVILAQQPPADSQPAAPSNSGWRRATDPQQDSAQATPQDQAAQQDPAPAARDAYGQARQAPSAQPSADQTPRPAYGIPAQVTLKQGTMVTLRISQQLASNKNAAGDTFSGALTQPVVVNGIVVAQRGQMVFGRVAEAAKVKGLHRLGIELTSITLADGSATPIHSQFMSRQGPIMPYGHHDEGVITTATADGSVPAAGAPTVGVLATKGHESIIYPGTLLTFQIETPLTVNTANANGAYRYVTPDDYAQANRTTQVATRPAAGYGYPYPYPYYGYGYPYWGPAFGFGFGYGGFGFRGGFRR